MPNPNWTSAEQHVPHLLGDLMHMGTEYVDGHEIEQYKHIDTRRYLNLDQHGQPWQIAVDGETGEVNARRVPLATAVDQLGGEPR